MKIFVRNEFNYDRDAASLESGLKCEDVSLAKQSFAEECDINTIVKRFGLTGQLPENVVMPVHGDFRGAMDFHQCMELIRVAREGFMQLPADVRSRFNNEPGKLVDFMSRDENRDEAVKLGLVNKPVAGGAEGSASSAAAATAAVVKP